MGLTSHHKYYIKKKLKYFKSIIRTQIISELQTIQACTWTSKQITKSPQVLLNIWEHMQLL